MNGVIIIIIGTLGFKLKKEKENIVDSVVALVDWRVFKMLKDCWSLRGSVLKRGVVERK